jgi:hypothetical protein
MSIIITYNACAWVCACARLRFRVRGTGLCRSLFLTATFYGTVQTAACLVYRINLWSHYHLLHCKYLWLKAIGDHTTSFFLLWAKERCLLFHVFAIKTTSQRVRINIYTAFVLGSTYLNPLIFPSSVHSPSVYFLSTNTSGNGCEYSSAYFTELPSRNWFQEIQFEKAIKVKE